MRVSIVRSLSEKKKTLCLLIVMPVLLSGCSSLSLKSKLTYGLYPQTNVNNVSLINALNSLTEVQPNGWYLYQDEYYAKLTAKPYQSTYKFDNGTDIVNGETYWFKCEPIEWIVLSGDESSNFVISSKLLDAHRYASEKSNNYKDSEIRYWLNTQFYNSAFMLEQTRIQITKVDNSASSTDSTANDYACDNTEDKVLLPSYRDYLNVNLGFSFQTSHSKSRECMPTDWAKANGAYYYTSSPYTNNGIYWTRSPYSNAPDGAWYVYHGGGLYNSHDINVERAHVCVRPAITLANN